MKDTEVINTLKTYLADKCQHSYFSFVNELETDENKDYRRGFLAGRLFTQLQLKADIGELQDAARKQPTD